MAPPFQGGAIFVRQNYRTKKREKQTQNPFKNTHYKKQKQHSKKSLNVPKKTLRPNPIYQNYPYLTKGAHINVLLLQQTNVF